MIDADTEERRKNKLLSFQEPDDSPEQLEHDERKKFVVHKVDDGVTRPGFKSQHHIIEDKPAGSKKKQGSDDMKAHICLYQHPAEELCQVRLVLLHGYVTL